MTKSHYYAEFADDYKKDLKKVRKNKELLARLQSKIKEILHNPYHYKPLRNVLKNYRRVQIGSFVLTFEVVEEEKLVVFHSLDHHDSAYKK